MRHLFCLENIDRWGSNWFLGAKMYFFDPKIWIFGAKSHFFVWYYRLNRVFCQQGISQVYPGLHVYHLDQPKKISVSKLGVIFRGSPLFLDGLGLCHDRGLSTLNFGPCSTKLGGTVRAIKKNDPEWQRTRYGQELRRNGRFYVRPKSVFLAKNGFLPKKIPKNS